MSIRCFSSFTFLKYFLIHLVSELTSDQKGMQGVPDNMQYGFIWTKKGVQRVSSYTQLDKYANTSFLILAAVNKN